MRRLREVDADRRDWRAVRVVSERGFMHELRSAIDGAARRMCMYTLSAHLISKTLVTLT